MAASSSPFQQIPVVSSLFCRIHSDLWHQSTALDKVLERQVYRQYLLTTLSELKLSRTTRHRHGSVRLTSHMPQNLPPKTESFHASMQAKAISQMNSSTSLYRPKTLPNRAMCKPLAVRYDPTYPSPASWAQTLPSSSCHLHPPSICRQNIGRQKTIIYSTGHCSKALLASTKSRGRKTSQKRLTVYGGVSALMVFPPFPPCLHLHIISGIHATLLICA